MLKVVIPALLGDVDNASQTRLAKFLSAPDDVHVTSLRKPLLSQSALPDGEITSSTMDKHGADIFRREQAHIMVWGEVAADERVIRLRFFVNPDLGSRDGPIKLDDQLDLPLDMSARLGKALTAAMAAVAVHDICVGEYSPLALAAALFPDMEDVTENPPEDLPRSGLHTLLYFVFRMRKLFYFISDETNDLAAAMGACGELMQATQDADPQAFARAAKEYGDLLLEFEDPDEDPEYLDTAVNVYDLARHIFGRDEQPETWADVTYRMGYVLGRIGWNRGEPGASEAAIEHFDDALSILTKRTAKRQWIKIIEAKSRVYKDLGRMTQDVDPMRESVHVLDAALDEVRRDEDPEEWKTLTLILGSRLAFIGEETRTLEPNQRAIRVLKAALTAIDRDTEPEDWAEAKNSLATALQFVGAELSDVQTIRNAIAAYTDALTVRTRDAHPSYWADTMNNLGNAYHNLGEFSGDAGAFEQAVSALEKALTVRTRDAHPFNWACSMNNLALAHLSAGRQSGDSTRLHRAIAIFQEALKQADENHPNLAHAIRSNMKHAEDALLECGRS